MRTAAPQFTVLTPRQAIQLRVMRITTLEEQHRELIAQTVHFKRQLAQAGSGAVALLIAGVMALHPVDSLNFVIDWWSYALVALLGGLVTRFL